jgi:putative ABC transport system ATP-binding protein
MGTFGRPIGSELGLLLLHFPPAWPAGVDCAAMPGLIHLDEVYRSYGEGERRVDALADVTIAINEGEFVVVLGPSGSGKTTLLNLVGALDSPTSGTISVAGRDLTDVSRRELFKIRRHTVSFVFQGFNLFPGLTARENVEFAIDSSGGKNRDRAREVLEQVGLQAREEQFPHQLSGGEQQRVAIARALATGNPVLLADEPTGELDFRTGVRILQLLRDQVGPGRVVLVVTHNREIARTADRVIELSSGRIVADGAPSGGRVEIADLHW